MDFRISACTPVVRGNKPWNVLYLSIFLLQVSICGCLFTTESAGPIENGRYVSRFDTSISGYLHEYEWEVKFRFSHYSISEIETIWMAHPGEKKTIWRRVIKTESGRYSVYLNHMKYDNVQLGSASRYNSEFDEKSILQLSPKDVAFTGFFENKADDSIIVGKQEFQLSQLYTFKTMSKLLPFHRDAD